MIGRFPTIGFLAQWQVYEGTNIGGYLGVLLAGIRAAAHDRGCNLLLASGIGRFAPPAAYIPAWPVPHPSVDPIPVGPWNTNGLIVAPDFVNDAPLDYLREAMRGGFPIVFTAGFPIGLAVGPDNDGGIRQAFDHLYEHGHRRIAFLAGVPDGCGDDLARLEAYKRVVGEYGLASDPDLIEYGQMIDIESRAAVRRLLERGVRFSALIASNDCSAEGAIAALEEAGLRVPEDVAVIGFDDQPFALRLSPPLTTVRHPTFEIGYRSVEVLLDIITGNTRPQRPLEIATQLIIRESCGCRPGLPAVAAPLHHETAQPDFGALATAMAGAACVEARHIVPETIRPGCLRLIEALAAIRSEDGCEQFEIAFECLIARTEESADDPYTLHSAIALLYHALPDLFMQKPCGAAGVQSEQLLAQVLLTLGERSRRYNSRVLARQSIMSDRLNHATARLLAALDPQQIFAVLADELPKLDIAHGAVVLFEPADDDLMAWSHIYGSVGLGSNLHGLRFRSRAFPPPGLYPDDEPFSLALLPLTIPGGASGFVAFDSTNLDPCAAIVIHLAAALRSIDLYRQANEGRRSAEEAARLKSRFLSTVSHELRTPLNLITGLSEVLLHEQIADMLLPLQARQDLQRIYTNSQHLGRLIGDVLDLASSEAGQLRLVCESLDIGDVLAVVLSTGEQMAHDNGLEWRFDIKSDLPPVWGDRTRLRQVVLNLISNAVKFTPQGSVLLEVGTDGDQLVVAVHDSGIGIAPDDQAAIFEEFHRADRAIRHNYGGLGLGLSICKQLIALHGGSIGVRSPGTLGGTSAYFTLPLLAVSPDVAETIPTGGRHVLLLAESPAAAIPLQSYLLRQGLRIEVGELDAMANWLATAVTTPPGAVVLSLDIEARHGWEILKGLKSNAATADVPLLCYSLSDDGNHGALLEVNHAIKPLPPARLAPILTRLDQRGSPATKTLVIVDDDPATLDLHSRLVRQQLPDCQIYTASDGQAGLAQIRTILPDLVLLDLMMPAMDGFEVLAALRCDPAARSIPVVVMTAQTLTEADVERLQGGVAAVLQKGLFSAAETLAHIGAALERNERLGSAAQRLVRRAMVYIHEHFAEDFTRRRIAQYLNVNEDYLTDLFHQELGITPIVYLNRYRVRHARLLLERGELNVAEVAAAVGYSDSHYLSRVFQREVGIAPGAYRRGQRSSAT